MLWIRTRAIISAGHQKESKYNFIQSMNKCVVLCCVSCCYWLNRKLPRQHLSHQQLCALASDLEHKMLSAGSSLCFGTMLLYYVWSRHLTSVQEELEEIDVCDYIVFFDVMALYTAGERERDDSSQQEQQ